MKLKITGPVRLGGKLPGQTFNVEAEDGVPLDPFWRARLDEEAKFNVGAVAVVAAAVPPPTDPAPSPSPAPVPDSVASPAPSAAPAEPETVPATKSKGKA